MYHLTLTTLTSLMAKVGFRLVKGDERIQALFQRDENAKYTTQQYQYYRVLAYLYFTEFCRIFHLTPLFRMAAIVQNLVLKKPIKLIKRIFFI